MNLILYYGYVCLNTAYLLDILSILFILLLILGYVHTRGHSYVPFEVV